MIKTCEQCGNDFDGHGNAKYCPDCKKIVQREQLKQHRQRKRQQAPPVICQRCGKEFTGRGKFCPDCRSKAQAEYKRRYRENHRKQRPKPVEKLRPLTKADLRQLMKLIRDAYYACGLILNFGGQSALTKEQLAFVEQKYPDHRQTLGDQRNRKFFDATDKFIELYQSFK